MAFIRRSREVRRWLAGGLALLLGTMLIGCGGEKAPAAESPRLLTLADLKKYPKGSAEAALARHFFFIQWGSARNLVAAIDPEVTDAVGVADLIRAYAFLRPALSSAKLRIVGKLPTNQGTLVMFEVSPPSGPSQLDSMLLGKANGAYVIRYDTQLDRAIPGSIRAATAGEPQTRQYQSRVAREISSVLRRYHQAAGAPALNAAFERIGREVPGDEPR